jgi:hypothetical protein
MAIPASNVLRYDFSDPTCYPGTGTSVTNLTNAATFLGTLTGAGFSSLTNSFQFDAVGEYISLDDINLSNNFTYITVFNRATPISPPEVYYQQTLFSTPFRGSWDQLPYFGVYLSYDFNNSVFNFNTNTSTNYVLKTFAATNTIGDWNVAAVTFSSGTANLYIDGVYVANATGMPSTIDLGIATQTCIGNYASFHAVADGQFTGQIAAFEAYNTVLSAGEISTISEDYLNRYYPPAPGGPVMGGRIFGEGFNG